MLFATLSISSFFLTAALFEDPFAALINSSAMHSPSDFIFLNAASLAPYTKNEIAWFTLLSGETSTACLFTTPPDPILVLSSLGPEFSIAYTNT